MQNCLFVDRAGNAFSTTGASEPAAAWSHAAIDPGHALIGLACPAVDLCVAADADGGVLTSSTPSAPAGGTWSARTVVAARLVGLSCPTANFCAAVTRDSTAVTSTAPAEAQWSAPVTVAGEQLGFPRGSRAPPRHCA